MRWCSKFKDLSGLTFGEWTVLERGYDLSDPKKRTRFLCLCSCGIKKTVLAQNLVKGDSVNCGHNRSIQALKRFTKHGLHDSSEYTIWSAMKRRCYAPSHVEYKNYGGRGISMCDRWLNSFENFYADMGPKPQKHSIDRIDNNGNYEPSNCRWATMKQQANNMRLGENAGVRKIGNKFFARIKIDQVETNLGKFETIEEARLAYKKAKTDLIKKLNNKEKEL